MVTREQALVKKIKEWTGSTQIGDDCAVLEGGMLVSTDTLVEGTHFRLDCIDWRRLGWRSCAVNLSDIAAMAGRPRYLTVALTLPRAEAGSAADQQMQSNLEQFYGGFTACASLYQAQIVGGDLTVGEHVIVNVTAIGAGHAAGTLRRSGARVGDVVVVTGVFGASAAGLQILLSENTSAKSKYSELVTAHLEPKPRLCESWALVRITGERGALMDASDGLADALYQVAEQSSVDFDIDLSAIPISGATLEYAASVDRSADAIEWALYGGEDYELVATMAADLWEAQSQADFPFKKIGVVVERSAASTNIEVNQPTIRLLENGAVSKSNSGVVDLNHCFKHFC